MSDLRLLTFCLIVMIGILVLLLSWVLTLLMKSTRLPVLIMAQENQRLTENNQLFLNQLRAGDPVTLANLNSLTLPDQATESPRSEFDDLPDLPHGYSLGDVTNDLDASGWGAVPYRVDGDGIIHAREPGF